MLPFFLACRNYYDHVVVTTTMASTSSSSTDITSFEWNLFDNDYPMLITMLMSLAFNIGQIVVAIRLVVRGRFFNIEVSVSNYSFFYQNLVTRSYLFFLYKIVFTFLNCKHNLIHHLSKKRQS